WLERAHIEIQLRLLLNFVSLHYTKNLLHDYWNRRILDSFRMAKRIVAMADVPPGLQARPTDPESRAPSRASLQGAAGAAVRRDRPGMPAPGSGPPSAPRPRGGQIQA